MSHDKDDFERLASYGVGFARLYIWIFISIAYLWAVCGVLIGALIINDGANKFFGFCVVAVGLVAWKIAGRLRRFKNQGS